MPDANQFTADLHWAAGRLRQDHGETAAADLLDQWAEGANIPNATPARPAAVITDVVAAHVLFHSNRGGYPAGSFTTKLLDAWNLADDGNAARLEAAFPDYAAAFALLVQPDGVTRLLAIAGGDPR